VPSAERRIVWSSDAEEDLLGIWSYLRREATEAVADTKVRAIRRAYQWLRTLPFSGRDRGDLVPGIRSILPNPYVIFYRVRNATVEIVRVLHGRRNIEAVFVAQPKH
jgi:toxin ParE1/3/4